MKLAHIIKLSKVYVDKKHAIIEVTINSHLNYYHTNIHNH